MLSKNSRKKFCHEEVYFEVYCINNNKTENKNIIDNNVIVEKEENKDVEPMKYKNEINLIYKAEYKGKQRIFGGDFVKNNINNIELIINGIKSKLIEEYDLEKGNNEIKIIIVKHELIPS